MAEPGNRPGPAGKRRAPGGPRIMARTMIRIGGYLIDAIITEESGLDAEVTEYPVESGAVITDHVRNLPGTLELEFVVSDTPIGEAASARPADVVPSTEARQKLEALRATRQPFAVITPRRTYASMVFTSLRFPLDGTTGDALRATATLKEIQIVDVRRVSVATARRHFGKRPATTVDVGRFWACPAGVAVSKDAATNLRNGCKWVGTADAGVFGAALVDGKTGEVLTDEEKKGLEIKLTIPRKKTVRFDETKRQWVNRETGLPLTKETVVPADDFAIPPTPAPTPDPTFAQRTAVGEDYYRSPFDR